MVSTYLSSKKVIERLLCNSQFVALAQKLVTLQRGSPDYLTTYEAISTLLKTLGITQAQRTNIIKSDGGFWYSNIRTPEEAAKTENHNTRPEIFSAVNYAWGNPITNVKIYPRDLRKTVLQGYGLAERPSSTVVKGVEQYVAKTYKNGCKNPLIDNDFTLRVSQEGK